MTTLSQNEPRDFVLLARCHGFRALASLAPERRALGDTSNVKVRDFHRNHTENPAEVEIEIGASFDAPVSLALLLRDNGLGLAEAHAAVTELAGRRHITLTVFPSSLPALLADLGRLGLVARG